MKPMLTMSYDHLMTCLRGYYIHLGSCSQCVTEIKRFGHPIICEQVKYYEAEVKAAEKVYLQKCAEVLGIISGEK